MARLGTAGDFVNAIETVRVGTVLQAVNKLCWPVNLKRRKTPTDFCQRNARDDLCASKRSSAPHAPPPPGDCPHTLDSLC